MLRKDREMDRDFALEIIDDADYGTLCLADEDGKPYGVPLSLARQDDSLFFHCAKKGKKVDCIKASGEGHLVFVRTCRVPHVMSHEEAAEAAKGENPGRVIGGKVFTLEFESAEVHGPVSEVTSPEEKTEALRLICEKYTPDMMDFFDMAVRASLDRTAIYRIDMEDVTAKRKMLGPDGEEMKNRMMR